MILKENPDSINSNLWWKSKDSICFGYIKNNLYVSTKPQVHTDLIASLLTSKKISVNDLPESFKRNGDIFRDYFTLPGRLWKEHHCLSFWIQPTKQELTKFIQDIKKYGINIGNSWQIETPKGLEFINDYQKGQDFESVQHTLEPTLKNQALKSSGKEPGYLKISGKLKNMSFAEFHSKMIQSEELNEAKKGMAGNKVNQNIYIVYSIKKDGNRYELNNFGYLQLAIDYVNSFVEGFTPDPKVDRYEIEYKGKVISTIKNVKLNESTTTTAPTSVSNGQFQQKLGEPAKRNIPGEKEEVSNQSLKDKIKKKKQELQEAFVEKVLKSVEQKAKELGLHKCGKDEWMNDKKECFYYSFDKKKFVKMVPSIKEWKDEIKGGAGDKLTPKDVNQKELKTGKKEEEEEHGFGDHESTEVSLDHLAKDPHYYSKMNKQEKGSKK